MALKLVAARLSNNPTAVVSPDGQFNVTKDGRFYFLVDLQSTTALLSAGRTRMISQQFDSLNRPTWKGIDPADIKAAVV